MHVHTLAYRTRYTWLDTDKHRSWDKRFMRLGSFLLIADLDLSLLINLPPCQSKPFDHTFFLLLLPPTLSSWDVLVLTLLKLLPLLLYSIWAVIRSPKESHNYMNLTDSQRLWVDRERAAWGILINRTLWTEAVRLFIYNDSNCTQTLAVFTRAQYEELHWWCLTKCWFITGGLWLFQHINTCL